MNRCRCFSLGADRPFAPWIALSLLLALATACGFPRPPNIGDDTNPAGCSRDQDCSSPTPFCVNTVCAACRDSTSCPLTRPVCDTVSHDCRTCVKDSECDSGACDLAAGRCVDPSAILYASPAGFTTDPCTRTTPCSLARAAQLVGSGTSYIVLQPGRYSGGANFNGKKATLTGSGASFYMVNDPLSLITIENNSIINMRNINMEDHSPNVMAETPGFIEVSRSDLIIDNMQSTTANLRAIGFVNPETDKNTLTIVHSSFQGPAVSGPRLVIDGCVFRNFTSSPFFTISIGDSIHITNTALVSDPTHETLFLGNSVSSASYIAHNTFVGGTGIDCRTTTISSRTFDSNIFYNVPTVSTPAGCQYQYNLSVPDAGLTGVGNIGNITGDPRFKDAANGDFHLKPGSAAIDTANPGDVFTGHDLDGTPRPQGGRSDIGAFEYVPAP